MIRLNLGSGETPREEGTINVDIMAGPNVDMLIDLSDGFPWPDNSITEIYSHHWIEHLLDPLQALKESFRVLCPGGICQINTPNMAGICREWEGATDGEKRQLVKMAIGNSGGYMRHQCLFWPEEIKRILEEVGFVVESIEELSQCGGKGESSMKIIAKKP